MVTAETKTNRYGSRYTYYHCSKRRLDYRCRQPSVRAEDLEAMVKQKLAAIGLAAPLHEHFTQSMDEAEGLGKKQRQAEKRSVEKALRDTETWLTNLRRLHVRGRFSQEEFEREEREIRQEQFRLQESLSQIEVTNARFEFEGMLDSFSKQAVFRFETGDSRQKRLIVRAVSSNTVLKDKVLRIEARKPFMEVDENPPCSSKLTEVKHVPTESASLETLTLLKDTQERKKWQRAEIQRMKKNIREVRAQYLRKDPELMEALHIIREIMKDDLPTTSE